MKLLYIVFFLKLWNQHETAASIKPFTQSNLQLTFTACPIDKSTVLITKLIYEFITRVSSIIMVVCENLT